MQSIDHTQARDAKPESSFKNGDRVRCILFDGSIVDGTVVGKTAFYVNVDVDGEPMTFDFDDVSLIVSHMDEFELRAKIVSGRFHTQIGHMNSANQANARVANTIPA